MSAVAQSPVLPVYARQELTFVRGEECFYYLTVYNEGLLQPAIDHPGDTVMVMRVRRGAIRAGVLRSLIGVLSLALLALGVVIAS